MIKIGSCTNLKNEVCAKSLGLDYVEVPALVVAAMSDEEFNALEMKLADVGIPAEASCRLLPGDIKIVGPEFDKDKLVSYCTGLMPRLARLGTKVVVLGSGHCRRIPDGYSKDAAEKDFCDAAEIISKTAEEFAITVVVEPLSPAETNFINTLSDGAEIVRRVDMPAFRLLADYYHMAQSGDPIEEFTRNAEYIEHIHIAHPVSRELILPEDHADFELFAAAVRESGYTRRVSVESYIQVDDPAYEKTVPYLRELLK